MENQEVIENRFEGFQFNGQYTWVALHDEAIYWKGYPQDKPLIRLCSKTLRIRANNAWSKLPKEDKTMTVAHELGHLEYQHYLSTGNLFRITQVLLNQPPTAEIEADRYACKLVGKKEYLAFLKRMKEKLTEGEILARLDYKLRIEALENDTRT